MISRSQRQLTPMWSADVMLNEPELVTQVHLEFIQAGAQVITLNTYTATPQRLTRDASIELLEPLHQAAMGAAKQAVQLSGHKGVQIAGCLPPLVASYHPNRSPDFNDALKTYRQLVELQKPQCDLFICETMASITEAVTACLAAKDSGKPVWVAFTLSDDNPQNLRSGESLANALTSIRWLSPDALLLNCSRPETINASIQQVADSGLKFGIYANGFTSIKSLYPGTTVESLSARKDLGPAQYAHHGLFWAEHGASIIGGCCEISTEHIRVLGASLAKAGFKIAY